MNRLLILTLTLSATSAFAQQMKPGLWEIKQQPQLSPAQQAKMEQAQQALANLPPDQRKMMEQLMAQRGVQVESLSGGSVAVKVCISKEQAEHDQAPTGNQGDCKHDVQRNGSQIRTHFSCSNPAAEGDTEITLDGSDHYNMRTRIIRGSETFSSSGEARWLGADCGALQPGH